MRSPWIIFTEYTFVWSPQREGFCPTASAGVWGLVLTEWVLRDWSLSGLGKRQGQRPYECFIMEQKCSELEHLCWSIHFFVIKESVIHIITCNYYYHDIKYNIYYTLYLHFSNRKCNPITLSLRESVIPLHKLCNPITQVV